MTLSRRDAIKLGAAAALVTLPAFAQSPPGSDASKAAQTLQVFKNDKAKARYMAAYDAVLKEWGVPYEETFCPTRFGATHVVISGPANAPPVVLLHAMLATATSWRPNIAALSQHFRCYAVDVIGEVNKSEPTRPLKNKQDCANWLADVLDALQLERTSIVGASLGGFFALNAAVANPSRIDRLVLIGPANILPMAMGKFMYYVGLAAIGIDGPLDRWMGGGIPWNPADNRSGELWAANREGDGMINSFSLGSISELEWRSVGAPTLLLIGDREVIYRDPPQDVLAYALDRIPGLQGAIVPNANHLAARANPRFVNDQIARFLLQKEVP